MATGLGIMNVMGIAILGDLLRSPRNRVAIFSHFPGSLLARVSEKLLKKWIILLIRYFI